MTHALLFEAKSIQSYLFASGRLRDVIGASELVDALTGALLDDVLKGLGLVEGEGRDVRFSRRAGGAFYAFGDHPEKLQRLMALWTLVVQQFAPGMAYDIALDKGTTPLDAFDEARKALREDSSRQRPRLPVAAPIAERFRRTGQAAEEEHPKDGKIDAATARKKAFADLSRAGFIERFSPKDQGLGWRDWPRDLEPAEDDEQGTFPFQGDDRTVALIHADGNGLGQLLMNARAAAAKTPGGFIDIFRTLSNGIGKATVTAARLATQRVLLPAREPGKPLPARPILLGGDDLTILVRADLAMDFVMAFVKAFEYESPSVLSQLRERSVGGLPERLTIGAGVVYMRASQPFYLASRLVESLMEASKRRAKAIHRDAPPSSLAFHRVTSSLVDEYDAILKNALSHSHGGETYVDTLGAYFFGAGDDGPRLDDLLKLQALLGAEDMARGPTRQLLTLMGLAPAEARARYRRWRQLMKENRGATLGDFDRLMQALLRAAPLQDLPYGPPGADRICMSPLGDALTLLGAGHSPQETIDKEEDTA